MARVTFDSIFITHNDETLEPRKRIKVEGVEFGPGVRFSEGTTFAGVDFALLRGNDLEIEEENGIIKIIAIYH